MIYTTSKVMLLSIITVCLLVLNLFLIVFLITQKRAVARREEPKKHIIETLNFDAVQIKKYQLLIDEFCYRINRSQSKETIFHNLIKRMVKADNILHRNLICN